MEFHSKLLQPLPETRVRGWNGPLPFYMSYPGYQEQSREAAWLRDMEYLQQLYPDEIKRYRVRIAEILDKTDYEGSMIYDEYPDKYSLYRLAQSTFGILQKENQGENKLTEELVLILLYHEIYQRRHGGKRGSYGRLF